MPGLIIGHTTATSSRIWLRGGDSLRSAQLSVTGSGYSNTYQLQLHEENNYTAVIVVEGLLADTAYRCGAEFFGSDQTTSDSTNSDRHESGNFRTALQDGDQSEFTFMFGSCNMHALGFILNPDRPFRRLTKIAEEFKPSFMLHCGDQIYYDVPNPWKKPDVSEYRRKYIDAWEECKPAKKLLGSLPNYMIIDDHEMVDNFSNDIERDDSSPQEIRDHSLKAYQEFQHSHNPQTHGDGNYYYEFSWGACHFFVVDSRTERWAEGSDPRLISDKQMQAFTKWLSEHKADTKFVVCSVPFVTEVIVTQDKWSGEPFRKQREYVMNFLLNENIENLFFLTGDMHHSYYAKLEISNRENTKKIFVHELMSSPINNRVRRDFGPEYNNGKEFKSENYALNHITEVHQKDIYSSHSNITLVHVKGSEVSYEVHRTKDGLLGWMEGDNPVRQGNVKL